MLPYFTGHGCRGLRLSLLVDVLVNHELDRLERMCEDQ